MLVPIQNGLIRTPLNSTGERSGTRPLRELHCATRP